MKTRIEIKEQARDLIRKNQVWKAIGIPYFLLSFILFSTILFMPENYYLPVSIAGLIVGIYELAVQIYLYRIEL